MSEPKVAHLHQVKDRALRRAWLGSVASVALAIGSLVIPMLFWPLLLGAALRVAYVIWQGVRWRNALLALHG